MKSGFTLIEMVVVMAIVAILAGILVPLTYKAVEQANDTATLQKLELLKKAMIGDTQLIQNGIRTDFGFVGDIGALPQTLEELAANPTPGYEKWRGPYLVETDSGASTKDSWRREINYLVDSPDPEGRTVSATLTSAGADGIVGTVDDIILRIDKSEVTPASSIRANLKFHSYTAAAWSVKFELKYHDPSGSVGESFLPLGPACTPLMFNTGSLVVPVVFDVNTVLLPIGSLQVSPLLDKFSSNCSSPSPTRLNDMQLYVHDRMSTIPLNAPVIIPR